MKIVVSSKIRYHIRKPGIFLIALALIAGMAGCLPAVRYNLTISSTEGGQVTEPGEGTFAYNEGKAVNLIAEAEEGYCFVEWTGDVSAIANVHDETTTITMNGNYSITADFATVAEIWDWYDLDAVRNNLAGHHILMDDLDSTTAGYEELASPTANGGKGWEPIGSQPLGFNGTFDGQEYEIRDLFIDRSDDEGGVGLFNTVWEEGVIENIGVVDAAVTGNVGVGGLVGFNYLGTVSDSYSTGSVSGYDVVGGLVGLNVGNTSYCYSNAGVAGTGSATEVSGVGGLVGMNCADISYCHSTGSVTGVSPVGGLVGFDYFGSVSNSYSTGSVSGQGGAGGLVGVHALGTVSNSYATGSVTGNYAVGGLLGYNAYNGTVSNSHYNYDEVLINGENIVTVGALFAEDFEEWLANDKFLDINERLSEEDGYHVINNVDDFKELLAFGQDGSLKFVLKNDLDLAAEPNFYIPYLAGEFDGNGHTISNLSFNSDFICDIGLFGHLAPGGKVTQVGVEDVNITGVRNVGGLAGSVCNGTVTESYASGNVAGDAYTGGLVGCNEYGTVGNCYSSGTVTGDSSVGGLVGYNQHGTVGNCYSSGTVTGDSSVGGLVGNSLVGSVSNSFWDTETSEQLTSDGGTGKNTTEMHDIATFSGVGWDIVAVGLNETNPAYIWNIVDDETYPFLSWQPV
jgi:hypothetical protein